MSNPTPDQLVETWNEAYNQNYNSAIAGRADAVYHVGALLTGIITPSDVEQAQNELADPNHEDYAATYHFAYLQTWNTLHGLLEGKTLRSLAAEL